MNGFKQKINVDCSIGRKFLMAFLLNTFHAIAPQPSVEELQKVVCRKCFEGTLLNETLQSLH
jgi:hypothetical protein